MGSNGLAISDPRLLENEWIEDVGLEQGALQYTRHNGWAAASKKWAN